MRFTLALGFASLAAVALSAPVQTGVARRSVLTEIGAAIAKIDDETGVTALEDELESAFGGALGKLEAALGVTFAEKLLQLSSTGASPGDLQDIGKAVYYLEKGLGVEDVDALLDTATGGAYTSLEDALGVTDLEAAIGAN